jgi:hypothetical protein
MLIRTLPTSHASVNPISIVGTIQQLLLGRSLNGCLPGEREIVLPAVVASGFCVLVCWGLLKAASGEKG